MNLELENKLSWSLLSLRLGVFVVMFMWTLDKFLNIDHAKAVFQHFYFLSNIPDRAMYLLAGLEMLILLGFLLAAKRGLTYGLVFLLHLVSTLSSFHQYLDPWKSPNLLFFAAWPMLGACFTLYILRGYDNRFSIEKRSTRARF